MTNLDSYSDSVLKHASSDFRKLGQRLFIFVIGGSTRSEVCCSRGIFHFLILPLFLIVVRTKILVQK
jgi:hypothetical protein